MKLGDWLRLRIGAARTPMVPGGPSFAHVFGWVLVMLLGIEALTGVALAAFYSPSSTDAWASVAYIKDRVPLGWLVRGLHFHAGSAIVIVAGIHLVQTAVWGAYKKPRELVWWLGLLLIVLVLGFAVTGYVLRWDQAGYWANRVEVSIAAGTPIIGDAIRSLAIGGNDYGNLTLTRFYALHVIVLPAIVAAATFAHVAIARRHGSTARWGKAAGRPSTPYWPRQALRDSIAMAIAFAALLAFVASQHGADLAAPADPSAAYDARPLWYFRWLFQLRHLAGSFEKLAALAAPAVVGGFLAALPLVDRGVARAPKMRLPWVGGVVALFAVIVALTAVSFAVDAGDDQLAQRQDDADKLAAKARALALAHGVPATGALDVYTTVEMWRGRSLYKQKCAGCHDEHSKDRKGPIIGPGHGDREWLAGFLKAPSSSPYWGKTKLGQGDGAMKPVEIGAEEFDALVEALYSQSGASDVDPAKRDRGLEVFSKACTDCHAIDDGSAGADAPGLGMLGSRDYYTHFIGNPKAPIHMGPKSSEMPRFDKELTIVERDAIAGYLVWLRTATPADVANLEPL